jgi:hypothetical protein
MGGMSQPDASWNSRLLIRRSSASKNTCAAAGWSLSDKSASSTISSRQTSQSRSPSRRGCAIVRRTALPALVVLLLLLRPQLAASCAHLSEREYLSSPLPSTRQWASSSLVANLIHHLRSLHVCRATRSFTSAGGALASSALEVFELPSFAPKTEAATPHGECTAGSQCILPKREIPH